VINLYIPLRVFDSVRRLVVKLKSIRAEFELEPSGIGPVWVESGVKDR